MDEISECYRILDLEPGASFEEVKHSYRELVRVWHPDRFRSDPKLQAKAEEKLKRINLAYERLCADAASTTASKPPFPYPPRPQQSRPETRASHAYPEKNTAAPAYREHFTSAATAAHRTGRFARLFRQQWMIVGFVAFVVVAVGVTVWLWKRDKVSPAVAQALRAAERGDAGAQFKLGDFYLTGNGTKKDCAKAAYWYQKAAAQGDAKFQKYLGLLYEDGLLGLEKDTSKAAEWYEKAASQGDAAAKKELADWYGYALKNDAKVAEWYEKAAVQGDVAALRRLAGKFADGDDVIKSEAKAVEWYQKAAIRGDATALKELAKRYTEGNGVPRDQTKAAKWYEKDAEQGDAAAKSELGQKYAFGWGVPNDEAKAFEWFQKAAVLGDWQAQAEIATRYDEGRGVPKNEAKAGEWFEKMRANSGYRAANRANSAKTIERYQKAADGGDAEAQFQLGKTYEFGLGGVSKDVAKAVQLYQKAAAQGHAECQHHLSLMYNWGRGVIQDRRRAFELAQSAAVQGNAGGQFQLGSMYDSGWGVQKDQSKAVECWQKAAAQDNTAAQFNLGIMYRNGSGVQRDYAKAAEWFRKAAAKGDAGAQQELRTLYAKDDIFPNYGSASTPISEPIAAVTGSTQKTDEAILRHLATDDRLTSGSLLVDELRKLSGKGKLTLDNGLAEDACVKLIQNGKLVAAFYVRSQEKFTYSTIPDGSYSVLYCTGYGWDGTVRNFARGRNAHRYDNPLNYSTRRANDGSAITTYTDVMTLTLHKVAFGNAKASDMLLEDFDRY